MRKTIIAGAKIGVAIGLVFWLIVSVDWGGVKKELSDVSWILLVAYIALQLLGNTISARKWQIIATYKNLHFSLKEGFFTYLTGAFVNNFLPSIIGGDAYRSLWLAKRSNSRAAAISTVIFDRFIGLWTIAFLALIFSVFMWRYIPQSFPLFITLIALVAFIIGDLVVTYLYSIPRFQALLKRFLFEKLYRLLEEIIFFTKKDIWIRTSLWAALFSFVGIGLSNFALFHALGSDIAFLPFLSAIFLVAIVSNVPISIGNIGVKEWAYVVFFGLIGVSVETAVTVALLSRFIQMMISFIALPQYLRSSHDKIEEKLDINQR